MEIGRFFSRSTMKPRKYDFGAKDYEDYMHRLHLFIEHQIKGGTYADFDPEKAIREEIERLEKEKQYHEQRTDSTHQG